MHSLQRISFQVQTCVTDIMRLHSLILQLQVIHIETIDVTNTRENLLVIRVGCVVLTTVGHDYKNTINTSVSSVEM